MAKKILLVDDAAFMRKMLKDTLSKNGYTDLYEAVDGADAVEKYDELKPDLVIMDITMPNMDGLEALKAIRGKDGSANILGINAQASDTVDRLVEMIPGAINKVSNFVSGFKGKTEDAAEVAETLSGDE